MAVGCEHLSISVGVQQFDQRLSIGGRGFGERTCEFHGNVAIRAGELAVSHAEHVGEIVRSAVGPNGHFVIGYERTHGGNQVAAIFNERTQAIRSFLRRAVERRSHDHLILGETFGRSIGRHEIAFDVELEQRVVHVAHHVVVLEVAAEREARFDEEPVERGERLVADHDGHLVLLLQVNEALPHFRLADFVSEHACLAVGRVRFEVVAQQTLPVGFERIVDGMPVPVFHHVSAGGQVRVSLQTKLSRERNPAMLTLRFGFEHEEVLAVLGGTGHIAAECDFLTGQIVFGRMVDVDAGDVHCGRGLEVVDGRLHAEGIATPFEIEIVGDELVVMSVFAHNIGLPLQEGTHLIATELVEFAAEGLVNRSGHIREVLPGIDAVRPVVKTEAMVQLVQIAIELLIQILDE